MGRPSEIKNRRTINIIVDGDKTDELLQYIGKDNFSRFMREEIDNAVKKFRKKVEAQPENANPLNLPKPIHYTEEYLYELFEKDVKKKFNEFLFACNTIEYLGRTVKLLQHIRENYLLKLRQLNR